MFSNLKLFLTGVVIYMPCMPLEPLDLDTRTRLERLRDWTGFANTTAHRHLLAQMRARPVPDPSAWGAEPGRRDMAKAVGAIAQATFGWPNANFIPEDPFNIVHDGLLGPVTLWDHMECEEFFIRITDLLGFELEVKEVGVLEGGTWGNFIDKLLDISRRYAAAQ